MSITGDIFRSIFRKILSPDEQGMNKLGLMNTSSEISTVSEVSSQQLSETDAQIYFTSELMISAGPRKRFDKQAEEGDIDLGEDIGSIIQMKDKLVFLLFDGTSDSAVIKTKKGEDIFSSRLLAQSIAYRIQANLGKLDQEKSLGELLKLAISETHTEWKSTIEGLEGADRKQMATLLKSGKYTCSTTILAGIIYKTGELHALRVGDSMLMAFDKDHQYVPSALAEKPGAKARSPQFFRLMKKADSIEIIHNDIEPEVFDSPNIHTVIGFSDGVSIPTQKFLKQFIPQKGFDLLRPALAKIPQKTQDDKSFFCVQLKSNNM